MTTSRSPGMHARPPTDVEAEAVDELVRESVEAQGLHRDIEDEVVLDQVARILAGDRPVTISR